MQAASNTAVTLTAGQDMDREATSPSALAAVQVFVTGNNGKTQAVQVDANQDVAEAVARQIGVNCVDTLLTFGGRPVKPDATYQDLGLQQGSTLRAQPVGVVCGGVGFYVPLHDVHANALESCQDCCKQNCCCCCT